MEKKTSDQKGRVTKIWDKSKKKKKKRKKKKRKKKKKKKKKKTEKECDEKNMAIEEKKRKTW